MQQRWFLHAVLLTALGLGGLAGLLRAADALPLPNPRATSPAILEQPLPMEQPGLSSSDAVLPGTRVAVPEVGRPSLRGCVRNYLIANVPLFCYAHHNGLGCGNFVSEFNFLFGSCRTFYGQPCLRGAPAEPVPADYLYGPGGYEKGAQAGCRCP